MIGIDTSFLVAFEIAEHPWCLDARRFAGNNSEAGFAMAPQVLTEFIHVTTDSSRFSKPLSVKEALKRSYRWWNAREVKQVFLTHQTVMVFNDWMNSFKLGRKRLLDTMLAATYVSVGIEKIVSTDARDFNIFPSITRCLITS